MKRTVSEVIKKRIAEAKRPHSNLNSWSRCYRLFEEPNVDRDYLALQLGFFLASWGMMRGSAFLKSFDYTAHSTVVDILLDPSIRSLRGAIPSSENIDVILKIKADIDGAYVGLSSPGRNINVTDTLSSKIMLAALGCVPAYDRFFVAGTRIGSLPSSFGRKSLLSLGKHLADRHDEYLEARSLCERELDVSTPPMRIVDMYFFTLGEEAGKKGVI